MTRSELILKLADKNPHLRAQDLENIANTIFQAIADTMGAGRRVELRGFGAFWGKLRDARIGRNPRTGESVNVAAKRTPFFKAGKQLKERLNKEPLPAQGAARAH